MLGWNNPFLAVSMEKRNRGVLVVVGEEGVYEGREGQRGRRWDGEEDKEG